MNTPKCPDCGGEMELQHGPECNWWRCVKDPTYHNPVYEDQAKASPSAPDSPETPYEAGWEEPASFSTSQS